MPASSTMLLSLVPPATPITSEKFDTSPSLTPNTAARSTPPTSVRWRPSERAMRPPSGMPCIAAMVRPAAASCCAMASVASASAAVAVGLGGLGAQHQRQHGLGAEATRQDAQRAHAERSARRARFDARLAQQSRPVRGVTLLGRRELQEDAAPLLVGVRGEPAEQRAAVDLVGVHLAQPLDRASRPRCRVPPFATLERYRSSVAHFPETESLRFAYPSCRVPVARRAACRGCRRGGPSLRRRRPACRRSNAPSASRTRSR